MSLTREQKKDLKELNRYFEKIKEFAHSNSIDLDVYMSEYAEDGFPGYATEKISLARKEVLEKEGKRKTKAKEKL
jgi:hypothetical protein